MADRPCPEAAALRVVGISTMSRFIIRVHLLPLFGSRRLDTISTEHVQQLKSSMSNRKAKTVNNTLTVLNTLLRKAVEWDVIERMPMLGASAGRSEADRGVLRLR
jgi:hypothetical protein